ncbi:MAG: tetratricopeptide repeat protein [Alphaproteobacteria bacterium]|nr:tetratricopeptide repeat protein [Alphaproteobacteria bacterium]
MEAIMPRSRWFAPLLAVLLMSAEAAMATQKDPALDGLFQRLRTIDDPVAAAALQQAIWETWIKADTAELDALMRQGMVQMARQRLDDAVETFSQLIEKAPDFAEAWNKRATVHFLRGDMAASVADIQRTVALEPRHFGAWSGLGMIMEQLGRPADAAKAYEETLKHNPHVDGLREHIEKLRAAAGERKT